MIRGNRIEGCEIGIHFTGGSADNEITGNAFVGNRTQIKFVSTRDHVWSGNYWSDHAAYDVNGDGIADQAFRPNDAMDQVLWTQPSAKLLLGSPAVQLVRWAQSEFPALLSGGIVDDLRLGDGGLVVCGKGHSVVAGLGGINRRAVDEHVVGRDGGGQGVDSGRRNPEEGR